ncbi:MAG: hypothetical protein MR867_01480 [Eubacterium sp.]|nr:hypothetical protein [Eubacterium sp.]MDD7209085.1 hypothetical protein [Lachnospiraceae bacterium]MDY5496798.1 hypothetical protein [Anaerobutyricum sp.]
MIRKNGLRSGKNHFWERETNPMEGVANLVDAMLVLACGLMMSVIMFYNVDLKGSAVQLEKDNIKEIQNYGIVDEKGNVSGGYESVGSVYEDKKTGKIYIVRPKEQKESPQSEQNK